MNRRVVISIIGAIFLLVVSYFLSGYLASQKKAPDKITITNKKKQVKVATVKNQTLATTIRAYGRVVAAQPIDLLAEVPGRITAGQVPLKVGTTFSQGSLLFSIDDKEATLAVTAQRSGFIKLLATILPDLKIDYPESYAQWQSYFSQLDAEKPLPPLPKYVNDKEKTFLSVKDVLVSYYNIKSAEERLMKYKLFSPVAGSFTEVFLEVGSFASPNARIAKIIAVGSLEVRVAIESQAIGFLKVGQPVLLSAQTNKANGKIARISGVINPATQSFDVYVQVEGSGFYDGQYVQVEIAGKSLDNSFEISRAAVFNQNQVYIVKDSLLQVVQVNILKINPTTMVVSGLEDGCRVVNETLANAYNLMPVWPVEDK